MIFLLNSYIHEYFTKRLIVEMLSGITKMAVNMAWSPKNIQAWTTLHIENYWLQIQWKKFNEAGHPKKFLSTFTRSQDLENGVACAVSNLPLHIYIQHRSEIWLLHHLTPMSLSKISTTIVGGLFAVSLTSPQIMQSLKINVWSQVGLLVSQMTRVSAAIWPNITRENASVRLKLL